MTRQFHTFVAIGPRVRLADVAPGPFVDSNGHLGFRSEYGDDAYVLESGEFYWGGAESNEARKALLVRSLEAANPPMETIARKARQALVQVARAFEVNDRDDRSYPQQLDHLRREVRAALIHAGAELTTDGWDFDADELELTDLAEPAAAGAANPIQPRDRAPLYLRAVAAAVGVAGLVLGGFALLNQRNDVLFALGLLCLLAVPYAAYRAGAHIIGDLRK